MKNDEVKKLEQLDKWCQENMDSPLACSSCGSSNIKTRTESWFILSEKKRLFATEGRCFTCNFWVRLEQKREVKILH